MRGVNVPRVIAHRGGRGPGCPAENTLAAFQHAYERGARAIELDVRPCASGEIVVMHDPTLARMTDGRDAREIASIDWSELARLPLSGGELTPTVDDVLAWARDRGVVVNVELKHDVPTRIRFARTTARIVAASRTAVVLSSFDPWLLACAAASCGAPRAILTYKDEGVRGRLLLAGARSPVFDAVHIERTQASSALVRRLASRGVAVGVWTVNDTSEARDLFALGASYVITDRPEEIAEAIGAA
jgi:glycerophosphoryl diester phosphodiesterase